MTTGLVPTFHDLDLDLRRLFENGTGAGRHRIGPDIDFIITGFLQPARFAGLDAPIGNQYVQDFHDFCVNNDRLRGWPLGYFEFRDVSCIGPQGAIRDRSGVFLIGQCLGWDEPYARKWVKRVFGAMDAAPETSKSDTRRSNPPVKAALLASGPGVGVFGHQLLDYAPRLMEALSAPDLAKLPVYRSNLKSWGPKVLEPIHDIAKDHVLPTRREQHFDRLFVPTIGRVGATLDVVRLRKFADRQRDWHRDAISRAAVHEKIFISRKNWKENNRQRSDVDWDAVFADRGFHIARPETVSFGEQVALASKTKVLAGMDGSGLHLAMFSEGLEELNVISVERSNPLHFCVASLHPKCKVSVVPDVSPARAHPL